VQVWGLVRPFAFCCSVVLSPGFDAGK
jgi:hypothetical protein